MIERIPFKNFISNNLKKSNIFESLLSEMPLKPIRFQNALGEYEPEKHHVVSTLPIFMDWDDIYYLYQFPSFLWLEAAVYRYNKVLYDIKKHSSTSDVRDIVLKYHGITYTFKNRNTFGKKLADKIERTVDVDHFLNQKEKSPDAKKSYEDAFKAHGEKGVDMGGYIGADLSDPIKTDTTGDDLWAAKGFMGIDPNTFKQRMAEWIEASSHGMLGDTSSYGDTINSFKSGGGSNAEKDLVTLNVKKLQEIAGKMIKAGAVPFKILSNGQVFYEEVSVTDKKGKQTSDGKFPSSRSDYSRLPILLPGKAIDNQSNKNYESLKTQSKNIKNITTSNVRNVDYYKKEIEQIQEDLASKKYSKQSDQLAAISKMNRLLVHISFDDFLKQKGVDPSSVTEEQLEDLKIEFKRHLFREKAKIGMNAKSYDNYDFNLHRFNKDRNSYDPLRTGIGNPFELGDYKFERLHDKVSKIGAYDAMNQSKSMIHGEEGDWETYFKDIFGVSDAESNSNNFRSKLGISKAEASEIVREGQRYLSAIGKKLASNDDVVSYLGLNPSNAVTVLSSYELLINVLTNKGVYDKRKSMLVDESAPRELNVALSELKNVSKAISDLEESSESGYTISDIQKGVEGALKITAITNLKVLKAILDANKHWIILNAQNYIKRNLGESSFLRLKKIFKNPNGISAKEKYQALLDAKAHVFNLAKNYTISISQLQFGSEDSVTGQGILSRRLRSGQDNRTTFNLSAGAKDDEGDIDVKDDMFDDEDGNFINKRVAHRDEWQDDVNVFVNSFFGELGKSSARKWRPKSDSTTHQIGHNSNVMYKLLQDEAEKAAQRAKQSTDASIKQLSQKNKSSVTHQEMQMLKNINNSLELFNFFVAMHKAKGMKGDAVAWAKDRMNSVLSRNNISINSSNTEDLTTSMRYAPADEAERNAVTIYDRLEAESDSESEISEKIVDMSKKVNSAPNPELAKHIIDRLRILNSEPQIFNTYAIAASQTDVVPNVKLGRLGDKLKHIATKHSASGNVPGMTSSEPPAITPQTTTQQPTTTTPPAATPQTTTQQPTNTQQAKPLSLADRLAARRNKK